jgi:putative membrane protein
VSLMNRTALLLGLVALAGAWLLLAPVASHAFWVHMAMHMVVVAIAAPCIALGLSGSALDPVRKAPGLFAAIPVSLVELVVIWAWHAPIPHHIARQTIAGLVSEQAMFLATGLWLWLSALGGESRDRSRRATGVVGLLLTSMHMTLLGALLALSARPLYDHHVAVSRLTPLEDQHLGGAIMLIIGGASYLAGGLWLTAGVMRGGTSGAGATA